MEARAEGERQIKLSVRARTVVGFEGLWIKEFSVSVSGQVLHDLQRPAEGESTMAQSPQARPVKLRFKIPNQGPNAEAPRQ